MKDLTALSCNDHLRLDARGVHKAAASMLFVAYDAGDGLMQTESATAPRVSTRGGHSNTCHI